MYNTELDDPICPSAKNMSDDIDLSEAFPGSNVSEACVNIQSKLAESGDQLMMDNQISDYIMTNGDPVLYYPYLFEIDKAEHLHGEHSAAGYANPFNIIIMTEVQDTPAFLTMQGFDTTETFTGWIHIKTFKKKVTEIVTNTNDERYKDYRLLYNPNARAEKDITHIIKPKPDDLIQYTLFGCDREYDTGNKIYKITNVEDEILSQKMNPVNGHYVWKITATRFIPSFQDGTSRLDEKSKDNMYIGVMGEKGNHMVHDNISVAKMFLAAEGLDLETNEEGNTEDNLDLMTEDGIFSVEERVEKVYDFDVNKMAKAEFDMEQKEKDFYKDHQSNILGNGYF